MGKIYCSSDWHGSEIGFKVLEYLAPDDMLYFLGDANDRGKYGLDLIDKLLNDSRVIYLMGNHEEMMINSIKGMVKGGYNLNWLLMNGGQPTWDSFIKRGTTDGEKMKYIELLSHLPKKTAYINKNRQIINLEHAGYTPWFKESALYHNPLWNRNHFCDKFDEESNDIFLVHGHTPVQYLEYDYGYAGKSNKDLKEYAKLKRAFENNDPLCWKNPKILKYCNGHKFDIDLCTIETDTIALLDLDTFEEIYFNKEGVIKNE